MQMSNSTVWADSSSSWLARWWASALFSLRQVMCRHEYQFVHGTKTRLSLRCPLCEKETTGWSVR